MQGLQIASDLHLEFGQHVNITPHAPLLALLGDIGAPFQPHYADFLSTQSKQFEQVFVLLGNHEYYGRRTADQVVARVQSICANLPKRHTARTVRSAVDTTDCSTWLHTVEPAR